MVESANLFSLTGKTALVTGASGGLGRYFATVLASAGARVVVAARQGDKLDGLVRELEDQGHQARAVTMDVTRKESVELAFDAANAEYGDIGVLVNNAGIAIDKPFLEQKETDWDAVMDTNLKGAWLVARAFSKRIADTPQEASIINIASILGLRVTGNLTPYCASKAGLIQLTKAMALELARYKIRVNAIAPGYVETGINRGFFASEAGQRAIKRIPMRRIGQFGDLQGPLLLLASGASGYMTGSVIEVDGGHVNNAL